MTRKRDLPPLRPHRQPRAVTATSPDGWTFTRGVTRYGAPSACRGLGLPTCTHAIVAKRCYRDALERARDPELASHRNPDGLPLAALIAERVAHVETAFFMASYDRFNIVGWYASHDAAQQHRRELEASGHYTEITVVPVD